MVCIRIELGGNGHKPPGQKSPGQKTPRTKAPPDKNPPAPDTQQAATYSIAAVAGNWTILVWLCFQSSGLLLQPIGTIPEGHDW